MNSLEEFSDGSRKDTEFAFGSLFIVVVFVAVILFSKWDRRDGSSGQSR